ncbi:MAG: DUF4331 family protein [Phaeodactylibacter sp.]|nr:DUF4331 family protein [Phaeodactylibacter sp.]
MKNRLKTGILALMAIALSFTACNEDDPMTPVDDSRYMQEDQMGRPAINTVFVNAGDKDNFNTTEPSKQGAAYADKFNDKLLALNPAYTTNALGLDAATFTSVLATDVLTVSTEGKTTFFDGTNVLTGRALADDVISVELLLIFGGPEGTGNPGLTDDNVDANDKAFLNTFPYLATPH